MKKIPHANGVARTIRQVRAATKKSLKGLNRVAADRMRRGDYSSAEALAQKGREIREFQDRVEETLRVWKALAGRGGDPGGASKVEKTPVWRYYQPILRAMVAAGGTCRWEDLESELKKNAASFVQPADRHQVSGGRERWQVMIRHARKPLKAEGWIELQSGKTWRITEAGRKAAERPFTER